MGKTGKKGKENHTTKVTKIPKDKNLGWTKQRWLDKYISNFKLVSICVFWTWIWIWCPRHVRYHTCAIIICGLYILKTIPFFSKCTFQKVLSLCMVNIHEQFIIRSAYATYLNLLDENKCSTNGILLPKLFWPTVRKIVVQVIDITKTI